MLTHIPQFDRSKILVIGDIMLDRYWSGDVERISPEAPIPVVHVNHKEKRIGGAGNVALNLSMLGANAFLIGAIGKDESGEDLQNYLKQTSIKSDLFVDEDFSTIAKLRVLSKHQQLLRLDFEQVQRMEMDRVLAKVESYLPKVNMVILSDYAKGMLHGSKQLIQAIKKFDIPILVDPKSKNFQRYKGATVLTPNRKEFERVVGPCETMEDFTKRGYELIKKLELQYLLITLGEKGIYLLSRDQKAHHFPSHSKEVYDVTGAGDTVVAVFGAALASGEDVVDSAYIANMAAGVTVSKLGASGITVTELGNALKHTEHNVAIVSREELSSRVNMARKDGHKIIMTNGCFDLLHAGHIEYLTKAKKLGGKLIIAVNEDDSISRLKGPKRPITALKHRMAVLSALECVDWVVPFHEDTPANLVSLIKPDILVKGRDYSVDDIVGKEFVESYGGEVKALMHDVSITSSSIIEKL